jgi:hypothetical protein
MDTYFGLRFDLLLIGSPFSVAAKVHIFNDLQSTYATPEPITYF